MAILSDCVCLDILAVFVAAIAGLITYIKWLYKSWERKNLPYVEPTFPFGTFDNPFGDSISFSEQTKRDYDFFKSNGHKHGGLFAFAFPVYMPIDPEYLKNILVRDFDHFMDRGAYYNDNDDPVSAHLFSIEGKRWRNLRIKLTPTFTSGKMKIMFPILMECSTQLKAAMDHRCSNKEPVDIKAMLGCFTVDVIGSCAFGIECNSFTNPNSDFRKYSEKVFMNTPIDIFRDGVSCLFPNLARSIGFTTTPKDSADFFMKVVKSTVDYREQNGVERKDFMQLLINLRNNIKDENEEDQAHLHDGKSLTMEELAAQAYSFFLAGFETSSTTMTFCLYELAVNQDIQNRLRDEVNAVLEKYNGKLTYDSIMEMKYMDQVLDETLRKYPSLPFLIRKCTKQYKTPGTDFIIEKGTPVLISLIGMQNDEEYFPEPEKFDPERFSEENKRKIVPYTYLPFGEGPRICIALRFGVMQTKLGIATLLKNYTFSLNKKTQVPLKMNPSSFVLSVLGGVWLDVKEVRK